MPFLIKRKLRGSSKNPLVIVIKKSVEKQASKRNLLRRRIRSVIRLAPKEITNVDLTIVAGTDCLGYPYQRIKEELLNKLEK